MLTVWKKIILFLVIFSLKLFLVIIFSLSKIFYYCLFLLLKISLKYKISEGLNMGKIRTNFEQ